jgi:uncharacterized protein YneF (UPF0154 family)
MNRRRHGSKPTIALWMLVAVADVAILAATGGLVALVLIAATLAVIAGGVFAARQLGAQKLQQEPRLLVAQQKATNPMATRDGRRA